jgi:hypothetical protein
MSLDELKELKELTQQSLTYYEKILSDVNIKVEEKYAFELCYDMLMSDMNDINFEIESRSK